MVKVVLKISGMHCTSCAFNIDGELEDTEGVVSANTSYAKQQTEVTFNPQKLTEQKIVEIIRNVGYEVTASNAETASDAKAVV